MPLIKKMKDGVCTKKTVQTDYGLATLSLFQHRHCANPGMLMLVSHGWQNPPAAVKADPQGGIATYAFLVPLGVSLTRTRFDGWAHTLAAQFASAPLAFASAGIPDMTVGAHYFEFEDKNYAEALERALPVCDIAVFDDLSFDAQRNDAYQQSAALPLACLLSGAPSLRRQYSNFLMHTCRSRWNPAASSKQAGTTANAQGLFAFDDNFRTWLD